MEMTTWREWYKTMRIASLALKTAKRKPMKLYFPSNEKMKITGTAC